MECSENKIELTGVVQRGSMLERMRYISDERKLGTYPEVSALGLNWAVGDKVKITIERVAELGG